MKLFLHVGTEKTGSSYLQSLCAINRLKLKSSGIWFPKHDKKDEMMLRGEISPGNAQNITNALNQNNLEKCEKIIKTHIYNSQKKNCHTLFLSNELLLLALAHDDNLKQFTERLNKIKLDSIEYILFLRDPVEQALSLYKHRAKSGKIKEVEKWILEDYQYGEALNLFLKQCKQKKIKVHVRKYSKAKGVMEDILFHECLGVNVDLHQPPKVVNPTLTLSDLTLLKKLSEYKPKLVHILCQRFINIKKEHKFESTELVEYFKYILSMHLSKFEKVWMTCNEFLRDSEKIVIPSKKKNIVSGPKIMVQYSDQQLEEILKLMDEVLSIKFYLKFEMMKLKDQLIVILRKLNLLHDKS